MAPCGSWRPWLQTQPPDPGIELFKINIYEKRGDLDQAEQRLRGLVERYPHDQAFNAQLLQFYLAHDRTDEAEQLLRRTADADVSDSVAGVALVRFLKEARGEASARSELLERLKQAADPFAYRWRLPNSISQRIAARRPRRSSRLSPRTARHPTTSRRPNYGWRSSTSPPDALRWLTP